MLWVSIMKDSFHYYIHLLERVLLYVFSAMKVIVYAVHIELHYVASDILFLCSSVLMLKLNIVEGNINNHFGFSTYDIRFLSLNKWLLKKFLVIWYSSAVCVSRPRPSIRRRLDGATVLLSLMTNTPYGFKN